MSARQTRSAAGFTLVEVLLATSLMLVILGATLTTFATMERGNRRAQLLNDSQTQVRNATDVLARRLRNLASPADSGAAAITQQPIERAEAQDLIFRSVNSEGAATAANPQNLQRYRYCLGTDRKVYALRQTWVGAAPATPADTACPGTGWPEQRIVAEHVVNNARPLFEYQLSATPGVYTASNSVAAADFPTAVSLRTTLWVDPDTLHAPKETSLTTRVFLRNQNRPPIPALHVTATVGTKVTMNGSGSEDPEGEPMTYQFFDNGLPLRDPLTNVVLPPSPNAVMTYKLAVGSHVITMKVTDVGNLTATSPARNVSCTSTSCVVS